jgi:hypothetical protein
MPQAMLIVKFGNRQVLSEFHGAVVVVSRLVEIFQVELDPGFVRLESYTTFAAVLLKNNGN